MRGVSRSCWQAPYFGVRDRAGYSSGKKEILDILAPKTPAPNTTLAHAGLMYLGRTWVKEEKDDVETVGVGEDEVPVLISRQAHQSNKSVYGRVVTSNLMLTRS